MTTWPLWIAVVCLTAVAVVSSLLHRARLNQDWDRIEFYQATLAALVAACWLNFFIALAPILRALGLID
jgi:hypothetical protein